MPKTRAPDDDRGTWRERRLVSRFRKRRDSADFEQLYELARRDVYAACLHLLREPAAAEDACHDVFVLAWERFASLRGERFVPWVRKMAVNHCLNQIRRRGIARRVLARVPEPQPTDGAERATQARQELALALDVLDGLAPHQREVLLLRHVDGLGLGSIAEVTGHDPEKIRSYLQNARRNFALAWERVTHRESGHREREHRESGHG
jgi:RNA polymerase sigma-70 factor (ECF subfamily)